MGTDEPEHAPRSVSPARNDNTAGKNMPSPTLQPNKCTKLSRTKEAGDPAFFIEADASLGEIGALTNLGKSPVRRFQDLEAVTPSFCLSTG